MAHFTRSGLWIAEREHTPRECEEVECQDCFELVSDPDEEFCRHCGEPLCAKCRQIVNDEPLCAKCLKALRKTALENLGKDPDVGDLFRPAA